MSLFTRFLSNKTVEKKYLKAGAEFGESLSYNFVGKDVMFDLKLQNLVYWEKLYSERGFKTISLQKFSALGGYGKDISSFVGIKLQENEKPVLYAELYGKSFCGN
jgi:hypothetical protein